MDIPKHRVLIFGTEFAPSIVGTATRTISHPASSRARICATVACTSSVFVHVIDWTVTGASPPITTSLTRTGRVFFRSIRGNAMFFSL